MNVFCKFGELADKVSANPIFLVAFNALLVIAWISFGTDVANIIISIITAEIVLVGAGAARRGNIALHAKLDELIRASDARDDFIEAEMRSEIEIQKLKV